MVTSKTTIAGLIELVGEYVMTKHRKSGKTDAEILAFYSRPQNDQPVQQVARRPRRSRRIVTYDGYRRGPCTCASGQFGSVCTCC